MQTGFHIRDAQHRVLAIYGENNLKRSILVLQGFLNQRVGTLLDSVYMSKLELARQQVVQVFAWICALANHANLSLENTILLHFPGICPSCSEGICVCKNGGRLEERVSTSKLLEMAVRLQGKDEDVQLMLHNIFPDNSLLGSMIHLSTEVGELGQAMSQSYISGQIGHLNQRPDFLLELADVVAHTMAVANLLGVNLIEALLEYLKKGCPDCKKPSCECNMGTMELVRVGSRQVKKEEVLLPAVSERLSLFLMGQKIETA